MYSYIQTAQYSRIKRDQFKYLNKFHEDWTIYIVISGSFRCRINGKEDVINKGNLYFIPPFVSFERSVIEPIYVHFIRFTIDEAVDFPFDMPVGKISLSDATRLQSTLQMLNDLTKNQYNDRNQHLCHLLYDLLLQYHYERNYRFEKSDSVHDPMVIDILQYLQNNYSKKLNLKEIAADFGISPSGLILKFRKSTGILPMRHLINIRIKKAKHLLVDTSLPLSEIAELTGFENGYYFSTAFKKEVGVSPSEYRKTYTI